MPLDQYEALVEEYWRDHKHAQLRATIMNASGNYSEHISVGKLTGEEQEAPATAASFISALKILKAQGHGKK